MAGIELLNEPAGFAIDPDIIQDFYKRGYAITQSSERLTVLHDAFLPSSDFTSTYVQGSYQNVALDTHVRHFSPAVCLRSDERSYIKSSARVNCHAVTRRI